VGQPARVERTGRGTRVPFRGSNCFVFCRDNGDRVYKGPVGFRSDLIGVGILVSSRGHPLHEAAEYGACGRTGTQTGINAELPRVEVQIQRCGRGYGKGRKRGGRRGDAYSRGEGIVGNDSCVPENAFQGPQVIEVVGNAF